MQTRPASVTVISVWLISTALLALVVNVKLRMDQNAVAMMSRNALPVAVQIGWAYAGVLFSFLAGVALLKRRNWARFLYVFWTGLTLLVSFITSHIKAASIPGLILFVIITFFLFSPESNEYFARKSGKKKTDTV